MPILKNVLWVEGKIPKTLQGHTYKRAENPMFFEEGVEAINKTIIFYPMTFSHTQGKEKDKFAFFLFFSALWILDWLNSTFKGNELLFELPKFELNKVYSTESFYEHYYIKKYIDVKRVFFSPIFKHFLILFLVICPIISYSQFMPKHLISFSL